MLQHLSYKLRHLCINLDFYADKNALLFESIKFGLTETNIVPSMPLFDQLVRTLLTLEGVILEMFGTLEGVEVGQILILAEIWLTQVFTRL